MSEAMQMIVNGYVRVGGRKNLEDLRAHRERLLSELRSLNRAVDPTSMIRLLEREIEIIEDGIAKLSTSGSVDRHSLTGARGFGPALSCVGFGVN